MKHTLIKVVTTGLVLTTSFFGLLYTSMAKNTQYYKHVDEVMSAPGDWYGENLQLHGFVVPNSVRWKPGTLEYRFDVQHQGHIVRATYTGVVPDTFKGDAEVVLKGVLGKDGFAVHPNGVMAKCPSKYEPRMAPSSVGATPLNQGSESQ